jgi:hypothetical protein
VLNNPLRYVDPTGHYTLKLNQDQISQISIWLSHNYNALNQDVILRAAGSGAGAIVAGMINPVAGGVVGVVGIAWVTQGSLELNDYSKLQTFLQEASKAAGSGTVEISIEHSSYGGHLVDLTCSGCTTLQLADYRLGIDNRNPAAKSIWDYFGMYASTQYLNQFDTFIGGIFGADEKSYLPIIVNN